MKGFLYRDLCATRRMGKFVAVIVVIFGAMAFVGEPYSMQTLLPIYCVMMFVNQLMNGEEKSGWMGFAAAVPGGRRGMVRSKYIILVLTAGLALLLEFLLAIALDRMGRQELMFSLHIILVSVGLAVLVSEVALPMAYTFGYRDGGFLTVLIMWAVLTLLGPLVIEGMRESDNDLQALNVLAVVPIAAVILFPFSYRASLNACLRRDF